MDKRAGDLPGKDARESGRTRLTAVARGKKRRADLGMKKPAQRGSRQVGNFGLRRAIRRNSPLPSFNYVTMSETQCQRDEATQYYNRVAPGFAASRGKPLHDIAGRDLTEMDTLTENGRTRTTRCASESR